MQPQVEHMLEKLEHLSPERLAEVEDFIDFLNQRDQGQALAAGLRASLRGHLQQGMGQRRRCHLRHPIISVTWYWWASIHQLASHQAAARGDHQPPKLSAEPT